MRCNLSKRPFYVLLSILLVFLYIFNIAFSFFPHNIRTRMLIGGIGVPFTIRSVLRRKYLFNIAAFNLCYIIFSVLTLVINDTIDLWFIQYAILNVVYFVGALWIGSLLRIYSNINDVLFVVVICVLLNNVLAFLGFCNSGVFDIISKIQQPIEAASIQQFNLRALGFGIGNFFKGGGISGLAIILTVYLYLKGEISRVTFFLFVVILLFTGCFIARTTIIGLLGFLLFFISGEYKKIISRIFMILLMLCIGIFLLYLLNDSQFVNTSWAFGPLLSLVETGMVEDKSLSHLGTMYILPNSIKTWVIGDGLFENPDGSYYMHTDVGYLRIMFYLGFIGILIFFCYQYILMRVVNKLANNSLDSSLLFIILLYTSILMFKGFVDFNYIFFLIIAYYTKKNKKMSLYA